MSMIHELRFAARQLRRTPGVTVAAVLTLALAIGANTAVFSAVRAVLLRPLPFRAADQLVVIWGKQPGSPFPRLPLSYPNFDDLRAQTRTLDDVAAWTSFEQSRAAITGAGEPFEVRYGVATTNLFRALGVRAAAGRTFSADERRAAAGGEVVVSHRLWSRFGLDRRLIGSTLRLDGRPYTVVGVLPSAFRFGSARVEVWIPTLLDPAGSGPRSRMYARGAKYLGVVARRGAGATPAAVQAELTAIAARLARAEPYFDGDLGLEAVPLREQVVGGRRPTLWLLLGAVGAVLLVGCANLAHLQLARAAQRGEELALRGALGAGRLRLARQLLAESFLLAVAGGTVGLLLAAAALRLLPLLRAGESESLLAPFVVAAGEVRLDPFVLAFTALVASLSALAFGLWPAWRGGSASASAMRPGARVTAGRGPRQRSDLLVAGQIAMSLLLLTTAGLLLRSLLALGAVDLGFRPASVVTIGLRIAPREGAAGERMIAFYDALFQRLAVLPGVRALGAADQLPLQGMPETTDFRVEGRPDPKPDEELIAHRVVITPGYLATMRTPLRRGRDLAASDRAGGQPVALVSEGLAKQLWPNQQPLGKRVALSTEALRFRADGPPTLDFASAYRTVVGVVADVRQEGPDTAVLPAIYVPFAQRPSADMTLVLRSALPPSTLARDVAVVVHELDRTQPLGDVVPLAEMVAENVGTPRARALLTSLFASLTLLLSCVGLYGVLAHAVATQRKELGVRLALGAARRQILGLVGKRAGRMLVAGLAAGALGSLLARQALAPFLFRLAPSDPVALLLALLALAAAAAAAALLPAWRATRVDPAIVLRGE